MSGGGGEGGVEQAATAALETSGEVAGITGTISAAMEVQRTGRCREGSALPKVTRTVVQQGGPRVHPQLGGPFGFSV